MKIKIIHQNIQYENLHDELNELYKKEGLINGNNKIPFWLILLRLLSNINNIYVDYKQENNDLSKNISNEETQYLKNKIIQFINSNKNFDSTWLNLCLKQLSKNCLNSNKSRQVYDFIMSLLQSLPKLDDEIIKIIQENLIQFNNKIFDLHFENQLDDVYNKQLLDNDESIKIKILHYLLQIQYF